MILFTVNSGEWALLSEEAELLGEENYNLKTKLNLEPNIIITTMSWNPEAYDGKKCSPRQPEVCQ